MLRDISLGYQQLTPSEVSNISWKFSVDGTEVEFGETASGRWDYYSTVNVYCDLELSLESVRRNLGITSKTHLGWVIVARSSTLTRTISSDPCEIIDGKQQISLEIAPGNVGGIMTVDILLLVLESEELGTSMFSPTKPGQVVYESSEKFLLEGTGAQLPVLPVSFSEQGFKNSSSANWWLRVNSEDLLSSSNSVFWLWLNTDNDELQPMLTEPESMEGKVWLKFLSIDFARLLLQMGISHETLETDEEYPDGSLGQTLQSVVLLLGSSLEAVRAKYRDDPSRVEAELQSIIGNAIG